MTIFHHSLSSSSDEASDVTVSVSSNPQWPFLDSEVTPPSAGGEGAANFNSRGNRSAESNDRRSVSECGGRRECNLYPVQQFAGCIIILI